jgi:tetratricopeptide (TPR) repeat protein/TolB-like protein
MGEVWLAEDTRLNRQVALKTVRAAADRDLASKSQLMREARAAAALNHPHIATVYDVLEQDDNVVIVFEFVEGETLHARIARGPVPVPEGIAIAAQIAKALAAAHAHGIVHRDLKPANVIISPAGHLKVLDFGLARMLAIGSTLTAAGPHTASESRFVGTPVYAAPEQMVSSSVDERADLYALGVVLFEMLSGRRPFQGRDPVQLATSKLGSDAPALSSTGQIVPQELDSLVAALLHRDRDRRPATASNVLERLQVLSGTATAAGLPARSRSPVVIAAAIVAVMLAGYAAWQMQGGMVDSKTTVAPVIAVLPLTNMSGDASRDFIAAGIAESLISSLAALPSVTVLSRASVAEARVRTADAVALTKDLGASYLIEGAVQESGGRVKVSLSLVRPDRSVSWSDQVEGDLTAIFELQARLASAAASALSVRMSSVDQRRMEAAPTSSLEALAAYWRGRAFLERPSLPGNLDAAIGAFSDAARIDPRFALAHVGLGEAQMRKYSSTDDPIWAERAAASAREALRLEPETAEVRYINGWILQATGRRTEAIAEFNRALAIRPNYFEARRFLGDALARNGDVDAAIREFKSAIALRPTSYSGYAVMGTSLLSVTRYQQAADALEQAVALKPDYASGFQSLGTAYQQLDDYPRALENYRKAIALDPSGAAGAHTNIGVILHFQGDFEGAIRAYRQSLALRPVSGITNRNIGDALIRLGRNAEAKEAYLTAMRQFEQTLKVNPADYRTLSSLAVVAQKAGLREVADARLEEARRLMPDNAELAYRAAVIRALQGNSTAAIAQLERALGLGYSKAVARRDDDLASVRSSARFKLLTE